VTFSEKEFGRAHYSVDRSGRDEFPVGAAELVDIVREAVASGGGLVEVMEVITTLIDEEAWERCNPELDDYGDYDYSDHDSTDSDSNETDYSTTEIREQVLRFVRGLHPELAAELET
jgi:hypothetical protein